jgi:hypothetical protein
MPNNTLRAASGEIVNQHRNINSVLDSRLYLRGLSGVICRWPGLLWVFWHNLRAYNKMTLRSSGLFSGRPA